MCIVTCLYSYRDDLPKNLFKITAQVCKNSTSGWRASLKNVAAWAPYCFALCKVIQHSRGCWNSRCGFWIPGIGYRIPCQWALDSRYQSLAGFQILWTELRTPKPGIPDSTGRSFWHHRRQSIFVGERWVEEPLALYFFLLLSSRASPRILAYIGYTPETIRGRGTSFRCNDFLRGQALLMIG